MPTCRQLALYGRGKRRRRCVVAALSGAPQRKGVVITMGFTTPKKPNSAKRKFVRVRVIASKKLVFAHPPGSGATGLIQYSIVMVEGGNPPDVPGINYTLVRGVYDFFIPEDFKRRRRRSKFGLKTPLSLKGKEYDPEEKAIIVSIKELR
jgi:small subunit ribosomal protein S12